MQIEEAPSTSARGAGAGRVRDLDTREDIPGCGHGCACGGPLGGRGWGGPQGQEQTSGTGKAGDLN